VYAFSSACIEMSASAMSTSSVCDRCSRSPASSAAARFRIPSNRAARDLTVEELLDRAPGVCPDRLQGAYCELERLRFESNLAWTTISIAGRIDVFERQGVEAGKLVPALVTRLDEVVMVSPGEFDLVLLQLAAAVASTNAAARRIERVIEAPPSDSDGAIELGRVLYNHGGDGVTSRSDFLAHRVGALVPTRVAALLGESVGETKNCTRVRRR
jgi:hypothetical protein